MAYLYACVTVHAHKVPCESSIPISKSNAIHFPSFNGFPCISQNIYILFSISGYTSEPLSFLTIIQANLWKREFHHFHFVDNLLVAPLQQRFLRFPRSRTCITIVHVIHRINYFEAPHQVDTVWCCHSCHPINNG